MSRVQNNLKFAIYDCPRIMARTIIRTLEHAGHQVIYEGPLFEKEKEGQKALKRVNAAPEADIWITKWTSGLTEPFLREFHPHKGIITISSGKGHIHETTLDSLGIRLENCPTFSSNSVAEHALALAFTGLYEGSLLPALGVRPIMFSHFSDDFAEQAVAHMLMRVRKMDESIVRARAYRYQDGDGRRFDEPWGNEELEAAKIGIIGRDRSALKLARILHDGFQCEMYGYDSSESLAFHGVRPMFITNILEGCDYIFMCTDKYGFKIPPDMRTESLERGFVDSRELPKPHALMSESNVAVLGTGGIGSIIARVALKGFKCNVTAFSRSERQNLAGDGVVYFTPDKHEDGLRKAVQDADFIFISAKLAKGSPPLIDGKLLRSLAAGRARVIVNIARDDMVESGPLYDMLARGAVLSYATDVLPNDAILWSGGEPDDLTRKFVQHGSVVPTPHEGDCSRRALDKLVTELLGNIHKIMGEF